MSTLVAIAFPNQYRATDVMASLRELDSEEIVDVEDAVYVTKDPKGRIHLHQGENLAAWGGVGGALWGMLFGVLFFVPLIGTAVGAGLGALAGALADYGVDDRYMRELAERMQPDSSAVFMLVRRSELDRVLPMLARYGGTVLHTSLSPEAEDRFRLQLTRMEEARALA